MTEALNPKYQYELQYKKDFEGNKDRSLLFSAIGNFFGKAQSSDFDNVNVIGNETKGNQDTRTEFKEARTTLKLDYTHPFTKQFSVETGAQYFLNVGGVNKKKIYFILVVRSVPCRFHIFGYPLKS